MAVDYDFSNIRIRITLTEEMLGTASANPELHSEFIASKAPDAPSMEEEVAALGAEAVEKKGMTVFTRDEDGDLCIWDYQVKGFFKDAAQMMKKVPGSASSQIKAFKKEVDGAIFVFPRKIKLNFPKDVPHVAGVCQRPLRASTAQGERVALASSETVPAGTTLDIVVKFLNKADMEACCEWLNYGELRGLGQWRNSGKGRFLWDQLDAHGQYKDAGNNEHGKRAARIIADRKAREAARAKREAAKKVDAIDMPETLE